MLVTAYNKLKRLGRLLRGEKGESTIEWLGITVVVALLMLAVIAYIDAVNGGPVGQAISDVMGNWAMSLEGGGGGGGGAVPAAGASAPSASPPTAAIPAVAIPAVGVPSLAGQAIGGTGSNGGGSDVGGGGLGGLWDWVVDSAQAGWDGFTNWAGQQWQNIQTGWATLTTWVGNAWQDITNWFNSLPTWVQGLLTGIAAALVIVAAVLAAVGILILAGITLPVSATVLAIVTAIAAIAAIVTGLVYGLLNPDSFNALHSFLWSLGAGVVVFAVALTAAVTGAAAAAWTWLTTVAGPAVVAGARAGLAWLTGTAWPALVNAARAGIAWVTQRAWPALVQGARTAATRLWSAFAARFPWLAQVLAGGLARLGWSNVLRWAALSSATQAIVYALEVYLGWREFSWTSLTIGLVTAAIGGALGKIFGVGLTLLAGRGVITTVIGRLMGRLPDWTAKGIAIAGSIQLALKTGTAYVKAKLGEWFGGLADWVGSWWPFSAPAGPPSGPTPVPVPNPVPTTPPPTTPTPTNTTPTPPPTPPVITPVPNPGPAVPSTTLTPQPGGD